ncbi:hypothetical protein FIBSPDRAFT_812025 [Athelia psychrophila]|uniref:Cupredoxin n=1 Tax=Athelia psychrophila TaxID=1759441 RepID=A0A166VA50_9AGAM|nr:hypothetical protein FIBSPDRAFT_812025 [Fibularhizoctonia sp. CBS 109695]
MMFNFAAFAALLSLAAIPAVKGVDHQVTVGGTGIIAYNPNQVTANPGDTVTFTFMQKNHTVTQSTLAAPCQAMASGFDSGFLPVTDNNTAGPFPTAQFTVQNTSPVWVYCKQTGHCQQGMVFAINPGNNFAAFQAAATGNSTASAAASATTAAAATGTAPVTVTATVTVTGGQAVTTTYASYPGSASPTAAAPQVHNVVVGGANKLYYDPANITAQIGDTISFQFMVKNHTVTQSSFATPCRSLTSTSTSGQVGFDSGFEPVSDTDTVFPTFNVTVNSTAPMWAYCKQAGHCGAGMVFSVNAVESGANNFAAFQAAAKAQNGTVTASSSTAAAKATGSSTSGSASGASVIQITQGAGTAIVFAGLIFGVFL